MHSASPLIHAFTRYARAGASSRVRLLQYLPSLRRLGVEVEVHSLLGDDYLAAKYAGQRTRWRRVATAYTRRIVDLMSASRSVAWVEKEALPFLPEGIERWLLGRRYIVDIDDAWYLSYSKHPSKLVRKLLGGKIEAILAGSSLVVAGNAFLADYAASVGARWTEVVPSVVDCSRYLPAPSKQQRSPIVVGWIGTPATRKYLSLVAPALRRVAARHPKSFEVHVVGASFDEDVGVPVRCFPWSEQDEVERIQKFDIGIMPLEDGEWERGKCAYKLVQYMAAGVPVVASSVGANRDVVRDGVDGFLVTSNEDWDSALESLADANLRARLGANARSSAKERYSLESQASRLACLLRLRVPEC